jgi:predicted ATP-grasp superfamily ATP-dependent carboligase
VKLREHPLRFGTATHAMSIDSSPFKVQSEILIKALNYSGVCEIEYLYDTRKKEYKLIEINPRTWLWVGLAKACGIDYAKMMYAHVHNMPFDYPLGYPKGEKWINHITDLPFSIKGILKREYNVYQVFTSYLSKRHLAIFKSRDPLPFLSLIFLLPLLIIKR